MIRQDHGDRVYKNEASKFRAVVEEIKEMREAGRPILVGTVSIEKSEELAAMLEAEAIPHAVLNAKQHEREASLVAQAGQKGAVTIATNMAGRGTDILLGFGVSDLGGLHIIGTERHESRRIDNQLRGRAGRQGDPGSSRFYVSLEDEIMRRSGVNQTIVNSRMFNALWEEDMPIEHNLISKSVETAQTKMEGYNFDTRKHLVEYDDVVNTQRDVIYKERRYVLTQGDPRTIVLDMLTETVDALANPAVRPGGPEPSRRKGPIDPETLFAALADTFSEDVTRRLAHHLLREHVGALIAAGDREVVAAELEAITEESAAGRLDLIEGAVDKELRAFYHVDDPMYETVQHAAFDYNKLLKIMTAILPLPAELTGEEIEGMEYDEALQYFNGIAAEEFERQFAERIAQTRETARIAVLRGDILDVAASAAQLGGGPDLDLIAHLPDSEREASLLLDLLDGAFPLVPASAAARLSIDPSSSLGATALPRLLADQLEEIYGEVQERLGRDFVQQNANVPMLAMVDNSLPAPVYREIEAAVGTATLEQVELAPLATLDDEVKSLVREAFVKHQESRWILHVIDQLWTRHLTTMESLRQSIGLQAYAQKDPLIEYKRNAFELFDELKAEIRQLGTRVLSLRIEPSAPPPPPPAAPAEAPAGAGGRPHAPGKNPPAKPQGSAIPRNGGRPAAPTGPSRPSPAAVQAAVAGVIGSPSGPLTTPSGAGNGSSSARPANPPRGGSQQPPRGQRGKGGNLGNQSPMPSTVGSSPTGKAVSPNDPCPCGSGRKYKVCHGR